MPPILVLGVARRSGTNFLASVLLCHRDCTAPRPPLAEDHLLRSASLLVRYVERTSRRWPPRWGPRTEARRALLTHVGDGLLRFLHDWGDGRRVVSKTPSMDGLHRLADLAPRAPLVLLVRDGRSVTESLVRGFGMSYDRAIREWRRGARSLLAHRRAEIGGGVVVRYESLVADVEQEARRLVQALELDPAGLDVDALHALPVVGSSFERVKPGEGVSWQPVRPTTFDPTRRHESWSRRRTERFAWLAGAEQRALGYDSPTASRAPWWLAYNAAADAVWPIRRVDVRHHVGRLRGAVGRRRRRLGGGTSTTGR